MRTRTKLGLAGVGLLAVALWRRRGSGGGREIEDTAEVSPINEPVPGDEPIDEEDIPADFDEDRESGEEAQDATGEQGR